MSANLSPQKTKGLSELWRRLRFVLFAVIVYRIGTHIPIPGIDPDKLASISAILIPAATDINKA